MASSPGARLFLVFLAIAACDGGSSPPRSPDAARTDPADAALDERPPRSDGGATDGRAVPDLAADFPPLPPPALRLALPGRARLAGDGARSCSSGAGDSWCAITRAVDGVDGGQPTQELWVVNGTRLAAGENIPCDGSSPHCRRLHQNLWPGGSLGGPIFPYDDRFEGETLIFYAGGVAVQPNGAYEGPVWAWRPGWSEARVISGDKGLFCFGHPTAAVAYCVENVFQGPPVQFDLRAGPLVDGPGSQLPLIANGVRPWKGNEIAWHAEFSPDATQFAISVQEPSTEGEVLHVGATAELGKKALREIAYKATYWRISLDGKKIYYLQDYGGDTVPTGKLVMADFPAGTNPVTLHPAVTRFLLLGEAGAMDRGVGVFTDWKGGAGTFRVIANRDRPSEITTVAEGVEDVMPSPDGRHALFVRTDAMGIERMNVARTDGQGSCVLNTLPESEAFSLHFLHDGELVFWSEIDIGNGDSPPAGWVARSEGCANKQRYAPHVEFVTTFDDRLAVFAHAPEGQSRYVQEYATIGKGTPALGAPVLIRDETDGIIGSLRDARSTHLILQVADGTLETQGVYLYGPLPR
jgi:hypothetical protein